MARFVFLFLLCTPFALVSQNDTLALKSAEKEIASLFNRLSDKKAEQAQAAINDSIVSLFNKVLTLDMSFNFPFDSLKNMGKIASSDQKVRMYTWNIPYSNGSHKIALLMQYKVNKDSIALIVFDDKTGAIETPETKALTPDNWFGAMYYEIIPKRVNRETYYFLLGFNPKDLFSNLKVIDVMHIGQDGKVTLGHPFFRQGNQVKNRVVFEYNEKAVMSLHYNSKMNMIVFNHLAPIDERFRNNYRFYGPDFSFDAYLYKDNLWVFQENVDVRND